jgi:hypothetical protein
MKHVTITETDDVTAAMRDARRNVAIAQLSRFEEEAIILGGAMNENVVLDIKAIQRDRAETMPGYRLVTFDEMEIDPPAKRWLIKSILARGETSAWIAPPAAMKSALLAEAAVHVGAGLD